MSRKEKQVDYRSFLFLGISLISIGLIFTLTINPVFISILGSGLCLIAISVANKKSGIKPTKKSSIIVDDVR